MSRARLNPLRLDPVRIHSGIYGDKRRRLLDEIGAATTELRELDQLLAAIAAQRRDVADRIGCAHRRLWPDHAKRGRRPAPDGTERLPPAAPGATALWGRRLRAACRAVLAAHGGPLELAELHARLHERGHLIPGPHPVKALSDAMSYEVELGCVRRVGRGVYELLP